VSETDSQLASRILSELAQIRRISERALESWRRARVSGDDYYIN